MIKVYSNDNINNDLYYFDGVAFQKFCTEDNIKGIPLDKKVVNYVTMYDGMKRRTLIGNKSIEKTCLYNPEEVNAQLFMYSPYGWENMITESMKLRSKGLDTMSSAFIKISSVLMPKGDDRVNLKPFEVGTLAHKETGTVIVKPVLQIDKTKEKINLTTLEVGKVKEKTNAIVLLNP